VDVAYRWLSDWIRLLYCAASTQSGRLHSLLWGVATHSSQMILGRTCSIWQQVATLPNSV